MKRFLHYFPAHDGLINCGVLMEIEDMAPESGQSDGLPRETRHLPTVLPLPPLGPEWDCFGPVLSVGVECVADDDGFTYEALRTATQAALEDWL